MSIGQMHEKYTPVKFNELNWLLSFQEAAMREKFFHFVTNKNISYLTLIICIIHLLFYLPFNISLLSTVSHDDITAVLVSCSLIVISFALGGVGIILSMQSIYYPTKFGDKIRAWIPLLNTFFIVMYNLNCMLNLYSWAWNQDGCELNVWYNYWYCFGLDEDSAYYSFLITIVLTPLMLIVSLKDSRLYLIVGSSLLTTAFSMTLAILDGNSNFALHIALWSLVVEVIVVDIHLSRVEKFLQNRQLVMALEELEVMQTIDREHELRHMIGNVAHDLKTPLSSITTAMEMTIETVIEMDEKINKCKQHAKDAGGRSQNTNDTTASLHEHVLFVDKCLRGAQNTVAFMFMTINRCIDYTKASKGIRLTPKYETIHLQQALNVPLDCMQNIQDKVNVIMTPITTDICSFVITDKQWLQENVLCLLSNAVKYSNGGHVTLGISVSTYAKIEEELKKIRDPINNIVDSHPLITASTKDRSVRGAKILPIASDMSENASSSNASSASTTKTPIASDLYILCEVEDYGIGLSEDAMTSLFNPFKQAQRLAGGTGLGLYSLAKRMDAIKGFYGVTYRKDGLQGSLFWFAIPYRPDAITETFAQEVLPPMVTESHDLSFVDDPGRIRSISIGGMSFSPSVECSGRKQSIVERLDSISAMQLSKGSKPHHPILTTHAPSFSKLKSIKKILLVDDSPTITRMMSMMLIRHGHEVTIAENGAIALEKIEEILISSSPNTPNTAADEETGRFSAEFDMIFMDMQMPVMDGIEATRRLRELESMHRLARPAFRRAVIIGMSANSDDDTKHAAMFAGVDEFGKMFSTA